MWRLMLCVLCLSAAPVLAQEDSLPPVEEQTIEASTSLDALAKIQAYMENVTSLKADFVQRAPGGQVSRGTLYLERPGRVRFDFTKDVPFLVVADGKTLNFVDYEIGQVQKWPVKDTPMQALLGKSFDLASLNAHIEAGPKEEPDLIIMTAEDRDQPELGRLAILFRDRPAAGGLVLTGWLVTDAKGGTTYVELSNPTLNPQLAASLWTFEDPRGLSKRRRPH